MQTEPNLDEEHLGLDKKQKFMYDIIMLKLNKIKNIRLD